MGPSPTKSFHLADVMAARWQLLLLAIAAVALSIASGWTTWDGITNFTDNSVLSFLITLGIQGVMLIAAWLIGETFADGELPRRGRPLSKRRIGSTYLLLCCAAMFIAACIALVTMTPPVGIWLLDTISPISFSLLV